MPVKAKWPNADQLDGYTATDFATADHAHTGTYAAATHDHDSAYAATDHGHDGAITLGGDASNHVAIVAEGAPANMVANTHYITEFAPLAPSAAQDGFSSTLIARLFRNSSDARTPTRTRSGCCTSMRISNLTSSAATGNTYELR